jgi:hypothetical protein
VAGRYEEIFAPEMMAPNPSYHFHAGGMNAKLEGQNNVKSLYRAWAETSQCIFERPRCLQMHRPRPNYLKSLRMLGAVAALCAHRADESHQTRLTRMSPPEGT